MTTDNEATVNMRINFLVKSEPLKELRTNLLRAWDTHTHKLITPTYRSLVDDKKKDTIGRVGIKDVTKKVRAYKWHN